MLWPDWCQAQETRAGPRATRCGGKALATKLCVNLPETGKRWSSSVDRGCFDWGFPAGPGVWGLLVRWLPGLQLGPGASSRWRCHSPDAKSLAQGHTAQLGGSYPARGGWSGRSRREPSRAPCLEEGTLLPVPHVAPHVAGPTHCFQVATSSLDAELKNLPRGPPPCAPEVLLRVPGPRAGSGASTGALDCGSGGLGAAADPVSRQGPSVHLAPQGSPGWEEQCPPAPLPPCPGSGSGGPESPCARRGQASTGKREGGGALPSPRHSPAGASQPMCSCNWMKRDGVRGEEGRHGAPRPRPAVYQERQA